MDIKHAQLENLDRIWEITNQAKNQLAGLGLDQWQKGEPSKENWIEAIEQKVAYMVVDQDMILGAFIFTPEPDASYDRIDGAWMTDGPYASVHRVCVADGNKGKGIAGQMFSYAAEEAKKMGMVSLRIDTHPGNIPMQHAVGKNGFIKCGEVLLASGAEKGDLRFAYERKL